MITQLCSVLGDRKQLLIWFHRAREERSTIYVYPPLAKYLYGSDPEAEAFLVKNQMRKRIPKPLHSPRDPRDRREWMSGNYLR